jgi:hypothetical protein
VPPPDRLLRRADRWLFGSEDARRLASLRIGLYGLLALRLATTDYRAVAARPSALFQPVSYMRLLGQMPSQGVTSALQVVGIVAALIAASGLALRASQATALVCSLILNGMLNSSGRVIVGDAVPTLCLLVLLACGQAAGEAWTVRAPLQRALVRWSGRPAPQRLAAAPAPAGGPRYGWPVRTAMVTVALSIFFAGFQKLRYSGLAWVTSDNLRWILYASSDRSAHANAIALFIAHRSWLAHLCAAGTLLLEVAFPLVLFRPRLRWFFVPGVVAMHEAIRLALGLDYSAQGLAVLIVFVDWPVVVAWLRSHRSATTSAPRSGYEVAGATPGDVR